MRRGVSDDRASKKQLIEQLAARRKETQQQQQQQQQEGSGVPRPKRPIIGLTDSDDDEEDDENECESTSDEEENIISPPPPPAPLQRFSSQNSSYAPPIEASDDLSSELENLSLQFNNKKKPLPPPPTNTINNNSTRSNGILPPANTSRSLLNPPRTTTKPPPTSKSAPAASKTIENGVGETLNQQRENRNMSDEQCSLVLGDQGEFSLSPEISTKLYPHQIEGVKWLFGLWKVGGGGILADDMGLGKTMQTAAFLTGLLKNNLSHRALILAPTTLIATWEKELQGCGLGGITYQYAGSGGERERALTRVVTSSRGGVLMATYGMVLHNAEALAKHAQHDPDDGPLWDIIIMDEGHKLKNPKMQLRAKLELLPVRQRIILSGTPIQNNLMEMHALFDVVCPGLLGDAKLFKDQFEKKINAGSDKYATVGERERGTATAAALRTKIAPHMLRREKKDVFGDTTTSTSAPTTTTSLSSSSSSSLATTTTTTTSTSIMHQSSGPGSMPNKNDFVVWLRLKPNQRALYEAFLNSDSVKDVLNRTKSALASLTVLKKICDHPALLSERAQDGIIAGAGRAARRGQNGENSSDDDDDDDSEIEWSDGDDDDDGDEVEEGEIKIENLSSMKKKKKMMKSKAKKGSTPATVPSPPPSPAEVSWSGSGVNDRLLEDLHTTGFEASCKTVFVLSLLRSLVAAGHRTLVFSQSRVMINILEAAVRAEGWQFLRIDGSVPAAERAQRVATFQSSSSTIPVFLLTSQVGGLGLTLTAADRVIVVDPAWNPSVDSQSVDRAYRIGQKRDVIVYRLISCGTVEDKIYRKQVFKGGLSRTGMQEGEQFRYFSAAELRDMFRLDPSEAQHSATQRQLHDLHARQRESTPEVDAHLKFLETLEGFAGVSDHDLLYSMKEAEGSGEPGMGSEGAGKPAAAAYQPGSGGSGRFASPSRRSKSSRSGGGGGGGGGGSQEWSGDGSGDIASMFGRVLSLGNNSLIGNGTGGAPPTSASSSPVLMNGSSSSSSATTTSTTKIERLQVQLQKQESMLMNSVLVGGLGDGGAKLKARRDQLKEEIAALQKNLLIGSTSDTQEVVVVIVEDEEEEEEEEIVFVDVDGPRQPSATAISSTESQSYPVEVATTTTTTTTSAAKEEGECSPPPPPPPLNWQHKEQQQQQQQYSNAPHEEALLSPFQKIKARFSGLLGSIFTQQQQHQESNSATDDERCLNEAAAAAAHGRRPMTETATQPPQLPSNHDAAARREILKMKLYEQALKLQAAEKSGSVERAVALRQEVEQLNIEYEAAKQNAASQRF